MNCRVHLRPMTEVAQIPPSWVYESEESKSRRGHQRRKRVILRCPIENCVQVGFEFDPENITVYRCSHCGRRHSNRDGLGMEGRCKRCRRDQNGKKH